MGKERATTIKGTELLGRGLYTPTEVSRLLRISPAKVNRWLFGTKRSKPVFTTEFDDEERVITFLDLIQAKAISIIRTDPRFQAISLQKLRDSLENLERQHKQTHLLARNYQVAIAPSGLFLSINIDGTESHLVEIPRRGPVCQLAIAPILKPFLLNLTFEGHDPVEWRPAPNLQGQEIVLNPKFHFGQPYLKKFGLPVIDVVNSYWADGGVEAAARMHEIPEEAVRASVDFHDLFMRKAS